MAGHLELEQHQIFYNSTVESVELLFFLPFTWIKTADKILGSTVYHLGDFISYFHFLARWGGILCGVNWLAKQIRNNLKSWRAAYLQSTSKMMKVEIAPVPNHSLNQSITHYIFMIAAFKKN